MLWVNLIMDSLGSLALATEPPYEELLQREPTKRNESMINGRMWKHIIIQSLCQIILLILLYLYAPEIIKEQDLIRLAENRVIKFCYSKFPGKDENYIVYGTEMNWSSKEKLIENNKEFCGKYANKQKLSEAYSVYLSANSATTHMSIIFNIFVFYTLFNQINCRVIDDSFNIFVRISKSSLFILICLFEMLLQIVIIFVGKSAFHVVNDGFTGEQWGICLGFSAITFIVSIFVKLIPIHNWIDKLLESKSEDIEEENEVEECKMEDKDKDDIKEIDFDNEKIEKIKIKMGNNNLHTVKEDNHNDLLKMSENGALNSQVVIVKKSKHKKY
jgi:magnesium-transporting ATPase (P-type)